MSLAPYSAMAMMPHQVNLRFRFQINGTSAPDSVLPAGAVKDITYTSAGVFAVQLPDGFRPTAVVGLTGTVMGDDGVSLGLVVQSAVSDFVASTGVLTVRTVDVYTDASPAAADPTDNDWVYVDVTFAQGPQRGGTAASI